MHTSIFKKLLRMGLIIVTGLLFTSCGVVDEEGNIVGISVEGTIALSWTPPTTNADGSALSDLSGYKIYYGPAPDRLNKSITISNSGITDYQSNELNIDLSSGTTYYFGVAAYNSLGIESTVSNLVSKDFS